MALGQLLTCLEQLADAERAAFAQGFFKTATGEYGAGDRFLGIRVPQLRALARQYRALSIDDTILLLHNPYHEARLLALLLMVQRFARAAAAEQTRLYQLYLANTAYINNWDLVDSSAGPIVGAYLADRERLTLHELAASASLWERRIAIMATFPYIRRGDFDTTLAIAERLLADPEPLLHKAVGWMLREVYKRDPARAEAFLNRHYRSLPRTLLRYAIEKMPEKRRQTYLKGTI